MGKIREWYIRVFEMPVDRFTAWAVFFCVLFWAYFFSWWMQEMGWP